MQYARICATSGPRSITLQMLEVLKEHLLEKPELYLEEMVVFLWDEFEVLVLLACVEKLCAL
jgi:hypothetical protein